MRLNPAVCWSATFCAAAMWAGACGDPLGSAGRSSAPRSVRLLDSAALRIARRGKPAGMAFTSTFHAKGFQGEQLLYRVRLVQGRDKPVRSDDGRFEDADGGVGASKSVFVWNQDSGTRRVRVVIPEEELELSPDMGPVWAIMGIHLADGTALVRHVVRIPSMPSVSRARQRADRARRR